MADLGICDSLKLALTNIAPNQLGKSLLNEGGTLKALQDPTNLSGQDPTPDKGNGYRSVATRNGNPLVNIRNYQRSNSASSTTRDCTVGAAPEPQDNLFELTRYRQKGVSIPLNLVNSLCGDATNVASLMLQGIDAPNTAQMEEVRQIIHTQVMLPLIKDVNKDVLDSIVTKIGNNVTTGDALAKTLNLFTTDGDLSQAGHATLITDFIQNTFSGAPIVIGAEKLLTYATLLKWGCCNNAGANFEEMATYPIRPYYDYNTDISLGTDEMVVFAPEMLKFAYFNENKWQDFRGTKHGTSHFGWFELPELMGVEWDVQIKENDCPTPSWDFIVRLQYDVWGAEDIFEAGDRLEGVNGVFRYVSN